MMATTTTSGTNIPSTTLASGAASTYPSTRFLGILFSSPNREDFLPNQYYHRELLSSKLEVKSSTV